MLFRQVIQDWADGFNIENVLFSRIFQATKCEISFEPFTSPGRTRKTTPNMLVAFRHISEWKVFQETKAVVKPTGVVETDQRAGSVFGC